MAFVGVSPRRRSPAARHRRAWQSRRAGLGTGVAGGLCSPGCVSAGLGGGGDGCGSRLSPGTELPPGLCFCLAEFPYSSVVLEYLESLFTVVWDAFASLEHLRVSSSFAVTQGSVNLSPVKGRVRAWPIPVATWHLFWTGDRLVLRCWVPLGFTHAAEGTDDLSMCGGISWPVMPLTPCEQDCPRGRVRLQPPAPHPRRG